jgi:hypothetical protein
MAQGLSAGQGGLQHITTVLTDRFGGSVAEQLLRLGIPGHDPGLGIDSESGVGCEFNQFRGVGNHRVQKSLSVDISH